MVIPTSALDQLLDQPGAPALLYPDAKLALVALGFLAFALLMISVGMVLDDVRRPEGVPHRWEIVSCGIIKTRKIVNIRDIVVSRRNRAFTSLGINRVSIDCFQDATHLSDVFAKGGDVDDVARREQAGSRSSRPGQGGSTGQ